MGTEEDEKEFGNKRKKESIEEETVTETELQSTIPDSTQPNTELENEDATRISPIVDPTTTSTEVNDSEISEENKAKSNILESDDPSPTVPESNVSAGLRRRKTKADFLDNLEIEKSSSKIQSRIKSELSQGRESNLIDNAEKSEDSTGDDLFSDALGESMEDFLEDFDDVVVVEKKGEQPVLSGPIIDILKDQGYIKGDLNTEEELRQIPEYEVLRIIIKTHPIPLEAIEEKSDIVSLTLVLSNLQADNLIEYTNDYEWTISKKVNENLLEFMNQAKNQLDMNVDFEELRNKIHRNTRFERQFIIAMYKIKVISTFDESLMELMNIHEFAMLKTIKDHEPVEFERIHKVVSDLPAVQAMRLLSVLENENRIMKDNEGHWKLTDEFIRLLTVIN